MNLSSLDQSLVNFWGPDLSSIIGVPGYDREFRQKDVAGVCHRVIAQGYLSVLKSIFQLIPPESLDLEERRCLIGRCLRYAYEEFADDAVEFCLVNGASPCSGVPEHQCYECARNVVAPLEDFINFCGAERLQLRSKHRLDSLAVRCANILRLLIRYGADPTAAHRQWPSKWAYDHGFENDPPEHVIGLHKLAYLALYGPEPVAVLIEETPTDFLNFSYHGKETPLPAILHDVYCIYLKHGLNPWQMARIFQNAVVPLLQAGARMHPDPFEQIELGLDKLIRFSYWEDDLEPARNLPLSLWGRSSAVLELLLVSRAKVSMRTNALFEALNDERLRYLSTLPLPANRSFELNFEPFFWQFYPLKLQAICRHVILNQLPQGMTLRSQQIDKLALPKCLTDYLKFSEFQVLTQAFE